MRLQKAISILDKWQPVQLSDPPTALCLVCWLEKMFQLPRLCLTSRLGRHAEAANARCLRVTSWEAGS